MDCIGRKIYYNSLTGEVLVDTGERCGNVIRTTQEQDLETYPILQTESNIAVLDLPYGDRSGEFALCKSMNVNVITGTLNIIQFTPEELEMLNTP